MKLDQLRKIIREEIRTAIKDELQEVMNEAVRIASTPTGTGIQEPERSVNSKPTRQEIAELIGISPIRTKPTNLIFDDPIQEMLNQTKQSMTGEDYKSVVMDSSMARKPNFTTSMASQMGMTSPEDMPGLDISNLKFVKNAKKVLDLANEKSGKIV